MKIISWNVNGIRAILGKNFEQQILDMQADIICLQETKAQVDQVETAIGNLNGYKLFANSAERKGYSGTAILTKTNPIQVAFGMNIEQHDNEGRIITAEYENFYLVTVYTPNSGADLDRLSYRKQWDADFLKFIKSLETKKPVIICGDLNVAHKAIDLKNDKANYNKSAGYTQTEIDGMDTYIKNGLVDTFRHFYPDTEKYSWWSYRFNSRAKNVGWRIDYFLTSERLISKVKDAFILNEHEGSDHCPVGIIIE